VCQGEESLRERLVLFQTDHNLVLPHTSLRQPLPVPKTPPARAPPRCGGRIRWRWPRV
jgi:hypothetical protein